MLESHSFFTKMVDELIEFSEYDSELSILILKRKNGLILEIKLCFIF